MFAPVALICAAIVLVIINSHSGYNIAALLRFSSIGMNKWLLWLFLPIAAVLSVTIVFNPFDLIASSFVGIVIVLFLLSLYLLLKKQVIDAIGLLLICLPFITYSEYEIINVTEFNSEWITLKIAIILVFAFFWFLITILYGKRSLVKIRFNTLILLFIVITLVSAIFSSNISYSFSRWLFEIIYPLIFYFIILNSIDNDKDIKRFMYYFIIGIFLNVTIILYYFLKYGSGMSALDIHFLNIAFADGLLTANILLMTIPLVIAFMINADSKIFRLLFFLLLVIGFIGLTLSFGRMAQISMAIGLLAFGLNKKTRKYVLLFAVIIVLFFVFDSEMIEPYISKYEGLLSFQNVIHASSMEKRFGGWDAALNMFKDHPLTGVGIGRYIDEYPNYASQYYAAYAKHNVSMISAHNMYLNYLAETGVPGFLILVTIFIAIVRRGFHLLKEGKQDYLFKFSLLISVLVFLINNLVDGITSAYVKDIDKGMVFWSITAMIMSYHTIDKKNIMALRANSCEKNIRSRNDPSNDLRHRDD
ncbi:MAG: O-antigen ligase family protein [Bacteroidota bacterium]